MSSGAFDESTHYGESGVYRGSDYTCTSYSEIEEVNEEEGKTATARRLDYINEDGISVSRLSPTQGSTDQDTVYLVVGKGETSMKALHWTLYNAVNPVTSILYLIHVFPLLKWVPSPFGEGKVPKSQVSKETLDVYLEEERTKRRLLLNKFMDKCYAHKVKVETVLIESDMVAEAILELISVLNIQNLVLGVSKSNLRKLRSRKGKGIPDQILQKAPYWCNIKYICEGKDALEETPVAANDNEDTTRSLSSNLPDNNVECGDIRSSTYCCFKS